MRDNWQYYQVENDEFSYSFEPPGIQMIFSNDTSFLKAKTIADEIVANLNQHFGGSFDLEIVR